MKFRITMKDPDQASESAKDAIEESLKVIGLSDEEIEAVCEKRHPKVKDLLSKWFQHGEYLTVEVDTETRSIRVVPLSEMED